jgi:predicted MFS family arabinose efflux permease
MSARYKVLASGALSLLLGMGVARFAYTPLLPQMQEQAGLGLGEAAWLAAINYLGYLSGALVASLVSEPALRDRLYRLGMVVAVLTTAMMAMTTDPTVWALSRYLAGLSTAASTLLGTGLVLNWLIVHDHRGELGIAFSGIGLGIAGSAAAVALMNRWGLDWREQWYAFTAIGCILLVPALRWMPAPDRSTVTRSGHSIRDTPPAPVFLRLLMASYFCAGVGYVVTATFIVAIVDRLPGVSGHGTLVFLFIGLGAAPASVIADLVARRVGDVNALILAAALQVAGILLPLVGGGLLSALCGAALFGATVMGIVSLVLTMVGRYYPTGPAKIMGKMTLSYGIAQVIAPAVTGLLAVHLGSYRDGLYLAAVVMAVGALLLVLLRVVEGRTREGIEARPS